LRMLRLIYQRSSPTPVWYVASCDVKKRGEVRNVDDQYLCLAVSDNCKLIRKYCQECIPVLTETLDEVLLSMSGNSWPRELTMLITSFL